MKGVNMPEYRKRPHRIIVHLNNDELFQLNQACIKSGYDRENYIRSLLNGYQPAEKPSEAFSESVLQLRRIGNNINQLTMLAHRTNSIDYPQLKQELIYLNQSIGDLREKVLLPRQII